MNHYATTEGELDTLFGVIMRLASLKSREYEAPEISSSAHTDIQQYLSEAIDIGDSANQTNSAEHSLPWELHPYWFLLGCTMMVQVYGYLSDQIEDLKEAYAEVLASQQQGHMHYAGDSFPELRERIQVVAALNIEAYDKLHAPADPAAERALSTPPPGYVWSGPAALPAPGVMWGILHNEPVPPEWGKPLDGRPFRDTYTEKRGDGVRFSSNPPRKRSFIRSN